MRQRVAIALALSLEPRLIVFDEPTTALDVVVQHAVMETIKELQRTNGFTALLISHDLGVVLEATDRVLVMYAGEIVEDQPAADLLTGPASPLHRSAAELLRRSARGRGRPRRHPRFAAGPVARSAGLPVRAPLPRGRGHLPAHRSTADPARTGAGRLPRPSPRGRRTDGSNQCPLSNQLVRTAQPFRRSSSTTSPRCSPRAAAAGSASPRSTTSRSPSRPAPPSRWSGPAAAASPRSPT